MKTLFTRPLFVGHRVRQETHPDGFSQRFDPLNDYLFCKVMGEKGCEVQLLGFINAVLGKTRGEQFTSIEILENKTFTPEKIGDKSVTFDVRAVLQGKTKVNVEVQLRNRYNMDKRSLFHWSREFSSSLISGQDFNELPDVIAINIVNFDYLGTKDFHSCFRLRDDKEPDVILTGALEIHFINMVRYRKLKQKLNDPLYRWLTWFNKSSPPELIAEVVKMDLSILNAEEKLAFISGDKDTIDFYNRRFMAMCDETSWRNYERGEGRKEGHQEKAIEIARNMKVRGHPLEEIAMDTGLSVNTVKKL
ncbi:MAG: Rpn family recombination-promoting nuclease/putative transposase [Treponema sp.]|nr:Rpn family recombination-promoting nuclease/putative transposase [Treponema sp.]